jgi:hypothetical protein
MTAFTPAGGQAILGPVAAFIPGKGHSQKDNFQISFHAEFSE